MRGIELWRKVYPALSWMKDAYAMASKLGLRPEDLSPVPEDGMYGVALRAVEENVPKGSTILDAGAGTLDFSVALAKRGYRVIAVEINMRMLEIGNVHKPFPADLIVVRSNFLRFSARYDAVVLLNTSWTQPLPKEWNDKIVITDAWWNGLKGLLLVIRRGEVVKRYTATVLAETRSELMLQETSADKGVGGLGSHS